MGYEILQKRISSFFGDELILGSFIVRVLPIFLLALVMNNTFEKNNKNIFYAIIISLACFVVYLSGERTAFGLLILFFFIIFLILIHLRKFITTIIIVFLSLSIILPFFENSSQVTPANRMFTKSYNQIIGKGLKQREEHKDKFLNKFYIFSHDHHGHYVLSYNIFKDHMITGTGVKGFRYLCRNKIYIRKQ